VLLLCPRHHTRPLKKRDKKNIIRSFTTNIKQKLFTFKWQQTELSHSIKRNQQSSLSPEQCGKVHRLGNYERRRAAQLVIGAIEALPAPNERDSGTSSFRYWLMIGFVWSHRFVFCDCFAILQRLKMKFKVQVIIKEFFIHTHIPLTLYPRRGSRGISNILPNKTPTFYQN
jgi:hypothetical protein